MKWPEQSHNGWLTLEREPVVAHSTRLTAPAVPIWHWRPGGFPVSWWSLVYMRSLKNPVLTSVKEMQQQLQQVQDSGYETVSLPICKMGMAEGTWLEAGGLGSFPLWLLPSLGGRKQMPSHSLCFFFPPKAASCSGADHSSTQPRSPGRLSSPPALDDQHRNLERLRPRPGHRA